uniref:(northern house mosquito) hypothetical protein n=1 Tax=Culex pipiens TaxID=7175 RepID=A0A8D8CCN8_CULPI
MSSLLLSAGDGELWCTVMSLELSSILLPIGCGGAAWSSVSESCSSCVMLSVSEDFLRSLLGVELLLGPLSSNLSIPEMLSMVQFNTSSAKLSEKFIRSLRLNFLMSDSASGTMSMLPFSMRLAPSVMSMLRLVSIVTVLPSRSFSFCGGRGALPLRLLSRSRLEDLRLSLAAFAACIIIPDTSWGIPAGLRMVPLEVRLPWRWNSIGTEVLLVVVDSTTITSGIDLGSLVRFFTTGGDGDFSFFSSDSFFSMLVLFSLSA